MREEVYAQAPGDTARFRAGVESSGDAGATPRRQRPHLREKTD